MKTFKQLLENIKVKYPFGTPVFISHDRNQNDVQEQQTHWGVVKDQLNELMKTYPKPDKDVLHEHYDIPNMYDHHQERISEYTSDSFYLNATLWKSHKHSLPITPDLHHQIKDMDHILSSKQTPHHIDPISVWSGVKFNPGIKAAKGGGKLFMPAYTSSSISPHIAYDFATSLYHGQKDMEDHGPPEGFDLIKPSESHLIRFNLHPGHHGIFVGQHSNHPREEEFILPRNLSVHISPVPHIIQGLGRDVHIWHAHTAEDSPHIHNDGVK